MIENLIVTYGLVAVLLGSALEGETVAFLGGISAHRHLLSYGSTALAASVGSFLADQAFFVAGRNAKRFPRIQRLADSELGRRVSQMLERHPTGFILAFRFIYGMRTISPIAIGLSHVATMTFVLLNAVAALVWGFGITGIGYLFGSAVEAMLGRLALHEHLAIGLVVAVIAVTMLFIFGPGGKRRSSTP